MIAPLDGKVVIVTGGARGLGRAYCETMAAQGASVVAADLSDASDTVDAVAEAGGNALGTSLDVTDPESCRATVTATVDREIVACLNVCAHRGAQVVAASGCSRRLTCPYHSWSYEHDGMLVAVPDAAAFPGIAAPGPGLRRLPAAESNGLVWVIPDFDSDPEAGDLGVSEGLGPIADDLDNFGLAQMQQWRTHRFELDLNWKLVIDTFLEPYHFASLHARLSDRTSSAISASLNGSEATSARSCPGNRSPN